MVLVKGICKNFGECDLADNKEIQEVEKTNFVCSNPDCGKPLHEIKPTKPPKSPVIWIVAAILLVCGVGMAAYWYWSRHSDTQPPAPVPIERIVVNPTECCLNVGDSVLVMVEIYPPEATDDMVWISSNPDVAIITDGFIIRCLSEGESMITVNNSSGAALASISVNVMNTPKSLPTPPGPRISKTDEVKFVKKFSQWSFSGSLKYGRPDGSGVLTFNIRRRIDMHDEKERIAEPGDYIKGVWKDGHLIVGDWFGQDNIEKEHIRLDGVVDYETDRPLYLNR